jgi:mannose PTS system EIIA component
LVFAIGRGKLNTIILITHGPLAQALLESAEMILGEQRGVQAICLGREDNLETARARVSEALRAAGDGVLVLADLFGGTASNAAAWALQGSKFELVAGVNLPMLLEALMNRDRLGATELAELAVQTGRQGVTNVSAMLKSSQPSAVSYQQKIEKAES